MDNILGFGCVRELVVAETTTESSNSSDEIVNIPVDLVVDILCKLPVKSLIRFKSVCRTWKFIINTPLFIDNHLHRKPPQLNGYALYPEEYHSQVEEHTIFPVDIIFIVGACNGIICLGTSSPEKRLLLFNPSTREFSFVPPVLSSWGLYGFCYLPKTQEYQIISFCHRYDDMKKVDIKILTLGKTTSLREVKNVKVPGYIDKPRQVTCGTIMVWLAYHEVPSRIDEVVIYYDVIEERFTKMDAPPYLYPLRYSRSLGVLKDSVIMFVALTKFFDIWMLVDDVSNDKIWMKIRKVGPIETRDHVHCIDVCWDYRWILCSKGLVRENEVRRIRYTSSRLFYYDFETDQVKDYKVTDPPIREFINYEESLVSVHSLVSGIHTTF